MTDRKTELAVKLAKLKNAYLARLPGELAELAALIDRQERLSSPAEIYQRLEKLHQRLHNLSGTSGTFGFDKLSGMAHALEKTVQNWLNAGIVAIDETQRVDFVRAIAALADAFGQSNINARIKRAKKDPPLAHPPSSRRMKVWLIEDDAQLGESLRGLLKQFDYEIRLFTQSDIMQANTPMAPSPDMLMADVLLTDGQAERTKKLFLAPALQGMDCPILIISSMDDFQSRAQAARLGAACFMLKPLDISLLVNRIEAILEERFATPYRVLIIDDDADLANHFRLVLSAANMDVRVLSEPEALINTVSAFHPEMILMDMYMPGYSGPELATIIRHHTEWIGLPIVYLSAETDIAQQLQAMRRGADDFITKPISDAHLVSAVKIRAARSRQLADLASKDSLTGLLKHALIKESLALELARAQRNSKPISIAMIDIDFFKSVNDTYGHAVGDRVIVALAHLLKQRLRKTDIIGRYGGEEFVAILPECDPKTAKRLINDIRQRFSAISFQHEGKEFTSTLSAGIASNLLPFTLNSSELLVSADAALYLAKHSGRNQVQVADSNHETSIGRQ